MIRRTLAVSSLAVSFAATPALADGETSNEARAEQLFERAAAFLTAKNFAPACPLLAESYRLDPAGGTLQNLAVCYEELGKWGSADTRFEELRSISKNARPPREDRVVLAETHLAALRPKLSRIVIDAEADEQLKVRIDDVVQPRASYTAGVVVDPGSHEISVSELNHDDWSATVTIGLEDAGKSTTVKVPPLTRRIAPPVLVTTHPTRRAGAIVGIAGLAAIAAGGVFGILTITKNSDADEVCHNTNPTGSCFVDSPELARSNALKDDARTFANVANVAVGIGLVTTAIGGWLFFRSKTAPRVGSSSRTPVLTGQF